jgi:hypothetical protein
MLHNRVLEDDRNPFESTRGNSYLVESPGWALIPSYHLFPHEIHGETGKLITSNIPFNSYFI